MRTTSWVWYVQKYNAKSGTQKELKDKSPFIVVARREDQTAASTDKSFGFLVAIDEYAVHGIEGPISGIPLTSDSGKKKILLLKGKQREIPSVGFSLPIKWELVVLEVVHVFDLLALVRPEHLKLLLLLVEEVLEWRWRNTRTYTCTWSTGSNRWWWRKRERDTNHVRNELELIASLFDEFLNLSTTETFLDGFPVMLLLAHLEAVPREALNGLASCPDSQGHREANDAGPSKGVSIMALASDSESVDGTLWTDVIIPPS
ncbi:hypothetical protein RJT34_07057 [Clitoria ternatea]|uniref:Uncharacterized protein n=1 Tax=Clitoria ternatea TaxID=43366 RepID=A0AAN9K4R8_CLITE